MTTNFIPMVTRMTLVMAGMWHVLAAGSVNTRHSMQVARYSQVPREFNFHRGQPRPLTCDLSPDEAFRQYDWFVEGGQPLVEWSNMSGVHWGVSWDSPNKNEIVLLPSNQSMMRSVLLYCVDDDTAIVDMIHLVRKENEFLYGSAHTRGPCTLAEGHITELSCEGVTWQDTGYCSWYWTYNGSDIRDRVEVSTNSVTLKLDSNPVKPRPGIYACRCQIAQVTRKLREFEVVDGAPRDTYYCRHVAATKEETTTIPPMKTTGGDEKPTKKAKSSGHRQPGDASASSQATTTSSKTAMAIGLSFGSVIILLSAVVVVLFMKNRRLVHQQNVVLSQQGGDPGSQGDGQASPMVPMAHQEIN